jgi:hypothetical protein
VKHRFLLDIMVLYFGIKGEDAQRRPDKTCANLMEQIGENCHRIVVDKTMSKKYDSHLAELFGKPQYQVQTALFLATVVHNSGKFFIETPEPPEIPAAVMEAIPKEDRYIVQAALISHPIIVTDDQKLRDRINAHSNALVLTAVSPSDALALAKQS